MLKFNFIKKLVLLDMFSSLRDKAKESKEKTINIKREMDERKLNELESSNQVFFLTISFCISLSYYY